MGKACVNVLLGFPLPKKLPEPGIIATEIVEDLEAALEQFKEIAEDMGVPEE